MKLEFQISEIKSNSSVNHIDQLEGGGDGQRGIGCLTLYVKINSKGLLKCQKGNYITGRRREGSIISPFPKLKGKSTHNCNTLSKIIQEILIPWGPPYSISELMAVTICCVLFPIFFQIHMNVP